MDIYFSVDVETDGPIPGPYSMLSFAIVYAGQYDGNHFVRPEAYDRTFYRELRPISESFQLEALRVNGLDRERLKREGEKPELAMSEAARWVTSQADGGEPVFVAYPLGFDWTWMYWYFIKFCKDGSPFGYSRCFDIKTAVAVRTGMPIGKSGRAKLDSRLRPSRTHTHHAIDDAIAQAEIFSKVLGWENSDAASDRIQKIGK